MQGKSDYTCNDYRQEMILLALKRKLAEEGLSGSEKEEIRRQIEIIESQMGMD